MKNHLLLFGKASREMRKRLKNNFIIHDRNTIVDWTTFLKEHGSKIVVLLTNGHDGASTETIEALPMLKLISCNGVGYDAVDVRLALKRKIIVTHTPGVLDNDVANTVLMQVLALSRRLMRDGSWIASGRWVSEGGPPLTQSIEGKHIGILGLGRIGSTIARKLSVFDCKISYHSRHKKDDCVYNYYDNLKNMAEDVDYLIVITPGDSSTYHLVDQEILEALGSKSSLVNIARGSVVDEKALVNAIESGKLGGAALDVFEDEPRVPQALYHRDNVLLTPHVGSATIETRMAMGKLAVDNIIAYFSGGNVISPIPECVSPTASG